MASSTPAALLSSPSTLLSTAIAANVSSECICRSFPSALLFGLLFSLIVLIGVAGNAFVVTVIVSDKKLINSSVNQFLLNLALADIGNLIFCSPDMAMVLLDRGWLLPSFACHYLRFLQEYFLYASVLLQVVVVISMWSVAAAFATPYFLSQGVVRVPVNNQLYCIWRGISARTRTLFKWAEFVVLYAFPLVLLTVLYTVMGRVLWGEKKGSSSIANEMQQLAILKLRRSVVKMLIISMLLYFLCYTPIQGLFVWETVLRRPLHLPSWLRLLFNAFSSANPIVYIMCCRHFHSRFVNILRTLSSWCACRRPRKYSFVEGAPQSSVRLSRSPYVSFRKSNKRTLQQRVSLV